MAAQGAPLALPARAPIRDRDRLGATLVLSVLLHALLILGIGFTLGQAAPVLPTLDVILTRTQTALTPKQADFLAQANNLGGGTADRAHRPTEPQPGLQPAPTPGLAPRPLQAQAPRPQPPPVARVLTTHAASTPLPQARNTPTPTIQPLPAGETRIERDEQMARLAAEIHMRSEAYAKRPVRKFVSASTREYAWAGYLRAWSDRVERVGNLNYPEEARRRRLSGELVVSVAVRRDGSVERALVIQSSGIPLLDAAALRIVRLAEPYPPLPETSEHVDILHITRTWRFLPEGRVQND